MSKRKEDPMLVTLNDISPNLKWQECIELLNTTYNTSFKTACKLLMCDRSWVQKYIRPHVHYIYLSSGYGKSPNYVRVAAKELKKNMTESVWLNTEEFEKLIRNNMNNCTRQTILVPIELLINPDELENFQVEFEKYDSIIEEASLKNNETKILECFHKRSVLIKNNLSDIGRLIFENLANQYKRSESKEVECKNPEYMLNELIAVHDRKDYGDSSEEIYRELFCEGCYRLELNLPDKDGVISKKIYYLAPKKNEIDIIKEKLGIEKSVNDILIKYEDYTKFFN